MRLNEVIAYFHRADSGWILPPEQREALARRFSSLPEGTDVTDLFRLLATLQDEGAPAASAFLALLRSTPAIVSSARQDRSRRESEERLRKGALASFEDTKDTAPRAPVIDAPPPPRTIPGRELMRPVARPRRPRSAVDG